MLSCTIKSLSLFISEETQLSSQLGKIVEKSTPLFEELVKTSNTILFLIDGINENEMIIKITKIF